MFNVPLDIKQVISETIFAGANCCTSDISLPQTKEKGYVLPVSVCLSVCLFLCLLDFSKSGDRVLINFWRGGRGPRTSRLDFGGDAGHVPNPGFISWIWITIWIQEFCKQNFQIKFLENSRLDFAVDPVHDHPDAAIFKRIL